MAKAKPLIQQVREALTARRGDIPRIAHETGIAYEWLRRFVNKKQSIVDDVMHNKLVKLAKWLGIEAQE